MKRFNGKSYTFRVSNKIKNILLKNIYKPHTYKKISGSLKVLLKLFSKSLVFAIKKRTQDLNTYLKGVIKLPGQDQGLYLVILPD